MDIERIDAIARKAMSSRVTNSKREPGYIYHHGRRVAGLASALAAGIDGVKLRNEETMRVGALFHDVAKGIEPHGAMGARIIGDLLRGAATKRELVEIGEIIALHGARGLKKKICDDVRIVQDADIVDRMGSVCIWLSILRCARSGQGPATAISRFEKRSAPRAAGYRELLNFDFSRAIFDEREKAAREIMARFSREFSGKLR